MIDFNSKQGFICDMDGVSYHGNRVLPGAQEFVSWLQREEKTPHLKQLIVMIMMRLMWNL